MNKKSNGTLRNCFILGISAISVFAFTPVLLLLIFFLGNLLPETHFSAVGLLLPTVSISFLGAIALACLLYKIINKYYSLKLLLSVSVIIGILTILFINGVVFIYSAWNTFKREDMVHCTYLPLEQAILSYEEKNGKIPDNLSQLIPEYIQAIPDCKYINTVKYQVFNGGNDVDLILVDELNKRVYKWRYSNEYTDEERKKILTQFHCLWTVFRLDDYQSLNNSSNLNDESQKEKL